MMLYDSNLEKFYTIFLNGISSLKNNTMPINDIITAIDINSHIF
jgi:hypothetical protein